MAVGVLEARVTVLGLGAVTGVTATEAVAGIRGTAIAVVAIKAGACAINPTGVGSTGITVVCVGAVAAIHATVAVAGSVVHVAVVSTVVEIGGDFTAVSTEGGVACTEGTVFSVRASTGGTTRSTGSTPDVTVTSAPSFVALALSVLVTVSVYDT